jgi:hypothetical protein
MIALSEGMAILINNWQLLAVVLAFVLISQLLLRSIWGNDLSTSETISLSLSGWPIPASLLSMIWIFLGTQKTLWIGILFLVVLLILLPRLQADLKSASLSTILVFALTVFFSTLLRLAFVSKTAFPSYFDSAFHFSVIKDITQHNTIWMFQWLAVNRYHINFHLLTAFIASTSHTEITQAMLVLGQVFLAFIPFSLFFPVKRATQSETAAWFAVILSAFGWYMPAHAVDWGKYPALMSLGMIIFVLSLAYLLFRSDLESASLLATLQRRPLLYGLFGFSILMTVFAHSRSLIVFGVVFLAWMMSTWWRKLPQRWQTLVFVGVILVIVVLTIFIQKQDILTLVFDPYLVKGLWVTILALFLSVFAFRVYPRLVFVCTLSICLLLVCLFVPVTELIPGRAYLTLLDRPFVEMILFFPLSLLGGLGVAGLENKKWGRYVGLLAIGFVAVNAVFTYNLYPSDCCVIVGKDDVVAMDWVANQLPVKARIGISSIDVTVNVSNVVEGVGGGDAGIWITPLTGRETVSLPYDMQFDQPSVWEQLCELKIRYLYVGEAGQFFDAAKLSSRPAWYRPLLVMPKTRVYEVIGCGS